MPWIAIGAAVVGGIMKHKSDKRADKQWKKGYGIQEDELALQREGLDFSKEQYADWQGRYDPVYDDMMSHIDDGITPDYNAIAGDINTSFDSAQGMERREMKRYGIKPTDGAYGHSERDYAIKRSAAHSGIRNKARQDSAGLKYSRLSGVHNSLLGVQSSLGQGVRASYGQVGNSMQDMAGSRFKQSAGTRGTGSSDAAGWGETIGGIDWAGAWGKAAGFFSDRRLKDNIVKTGSWNGINLYSWDWNDLARKHGIKGLTTGVIAQEHLDSGFVHEAENGFLYVDYDGLFGSSRRVA